MSETHRKPHRILFNLFFMLYLLMLAYFLFRTRYSMRSFNLVPFRAIWTYLTDKDPTLRAFALNGMLRGIGLFVPMGVYFMTLRRRKRPLRCVVQIALVSAAAELIQYFTRTGVADVDDVLLSALGAYLGTRVYRALLSVFGSHANARFAVSLLAPVAAVLFFLVFRVYSA